MNLRVLRYGQKPTIYHLPFQLSKSQIIFIDSTRKRSFQPPPILPNLVGVVHQYFRRCY